MHAAAGSGRFWWIPSIPEPDIKQAVRRNVSRDEAMR
jgi:hypothetical protein